MTNFETSTEARRQARNVLIVNATIILLASHAFVLVVIKKIADSPTVPAEGIGYIAGALTLYMLAANLAVCIYFAIVLPIRYRSTYAYQVDLVGNRIKIYKRSRVAEIPISELTHVFVEKVQANRILQMVLKSPELGLTILSPGLDKTEIWNQISPKLSSQTKVFERNARVGLYHPFSVGFAAVSCLSVASFYMGELAVGLGCIAFAGCLFFATFLISRKTE